MCCTKLTDNLRGLKSLADSVEYLSEQAKDKASQLFRDIEDNSTVLGDYLIISQGDLYDIELRALSIHYDAIDKAREIIDVLDEIEDDLSAPEGETEEE